MTQPKKSFAEVRAILDRIQFMDRKILLMEKFGSEGFLIQIAYWEPDVETGELTYQKARKWYVSPFSTTTEVVRTAYKAVKTSMEHVVDEHFLYRGKRIYSPHYDVEALASGELDKARADHRELLVVSGMPVPGTRMK